MRGEVNSPRSWTGYITGNFNGGIVGTWVGINRHGSRRAALYSETVKGNQRVCPKDTRNSPRDGYARATNAGKQGFEVGQQNAGALQKEMRSEIKLVQDELRTIQTRLRVCETAPNQQPWDSELAASFLQNWLRQETQVVKKNSDGDGSTRKMRPFMPLLTKK